MALRFPGSLCRTLNPAIPPNDHGTLNVGATAPHGSTGREVSKFQAGSCNLRFRKIHGPFADRFSKIQVYEVTGGNFSAYVYRCRLNLDIDGAPTTYGYDNPNAPTGLQHNLNPLEHYNKKGVSVPMSQKIGLGNACGDPGDGSKGWKNFLHTNTRLFCWVGVKAVTKKQAKQMNLTIDDRPELEAGLSGRSKNPVPLPKGMGYFPVVQDANGPAPGYYVSTTSVAADGSLSEFDPNRYLDASVVPYAVWANCWANFKTGGQSVSQGDYGIAIRHDTGATTGYVYGDSGTPNKVGEVSQFLYNALGGDGGYVTFIAFPGSGSGKVLGAHPEGQIKDHVSPRMLALGTDNFSMLVAGLAAAPHMDRANAFSPEQSKLVGKLQSALLPYMDRTNAFSPEQVEFTWKLLSALLPWIQPKSK